ncbi:MAG: beta-galactosidase trimerization domain-containing protein [Acidobacteria bacterium]|nr:beta-galactosidase trimerization domain-containing protein [Acidobacteriota bacterium]
MKKRLSLALALLTLSMLAPFAAARQDLKEEGVGGSAFHKNDITYSTQVSTPHVAWAKKLPGGPVRGFFIPPVQYGRDMVELMQRLDLAPTTVTIDRNWDTSCWGIGDYYGHEYRGDRDDFQTVYGYVERDLTGPAQFEVMLIPGLNGWSRMTRAARDAVLRRVREGAGLVLLHPFVGDVKGHPFKGDEAEPDARIWDISPLVGVPDDTLNERGYPEINQDAVAKGKWEATHPHFITDGVPLELLPEGQVGGSFYKYRADGDVLVRSGERPVVAVKNYGKGRVVALAYVEEGFTPQSVNPFETRIYWDYWEYQYSLLARALLWAAGREPAARLTSLAATDAEPAVKLTVTSDAARSVETEVACKSEFGQKLGSTKVRRELARGENSIAVAASVLRPAAGWPGGRAIFDVIVRDARTGATLDWGAATFNAPKRAMMTLVKPAVDVYKRGETLSAVLRAAGDLAGLRLRMKVSDDLGRLLAVVEQPARGERTMTYALSDFVAKSALVTGELVDAKGAVVDQLRAAPVMVVQDERREREYTALVSFGGTKHYLQDAQMRQVRAVAADTGFTWGGGVDNSLNVPRGSFGVYWYDRGPTTPDAMEKAIADYKRTQDFDALGYLTKKELYRRTGDKTFLRRTPSFDDPAFMRSLTDIARATARNKARYQMDYYFVGDEGSLTSYGDPFDFDWSPHALAEFRAWLRGEYKTLDALNREWKSSFKSWDEVVPSTTDEARKANNFAPWADHRTYMEVSFARAYQRVRDAVREGDPDGHVAVSGTQATNAYNGADWARLDRVIDDFLSYDGGNQWDMHRSFAKPGAMIGFWTGYGSRGLSVENAIWTAAAQNVLHPNVFWMYSFLDPDMTHSESARDMGAAFKSLRFEGVGKLLMESARQQDGVAIHYSMSSIHAATILGYHQRRGDEEEGAKVEEAVSFPGDRDGWVRVTKDLGLQFDFVSSEQVEQGGLSSGKYKVLVLPLSLALSEEELKSIEAFARGGGTVIADAGAGVTDEHCAWRIDGSLEKLFGVQLASAPDVRRLKGSGEKLTLTGAGAAFGIRAEDLAGLNAAEPGLKAAGGEALARAGDADAVVIRRVGSGRTIYLNALLDRYAKLRAEKSGGDAQRALVNTLLERAGVRPAIELLSAGGRRLTHALVARYKFGESEVLTVVTDNVKLEGVVGRDGVTVYNDAGLGRVARQEITVRLPRKAYVTDVRTGKRFGLTDTVHTSVVVGDALVLGLSPAAGAVTLSGPPSAALGAHVRFDIHVAPAGRHLVRCHFLAPDGSLLEAYAKNVLAEEGRASVVLPSALNDPAGVYTLRVTDVVTGATAEAKVELK